MCTPLLAKRSNALLTASSDMPLHQRLLARQKPRCRCLQLDRVPGMSEFCNHAQVILFDKQLARGGYYAMTPAAWNSKDVRAV